MLTNSLFHVFRNTPFGRDTLLQSAYFAKKMGIPITLYIPRHHQFLMYFSRRAVTVDLDRGFMNDPQTADEHARAVLDEQGVKYFFYEPLDFTAIELPDIPVALRYMCCPRSISDLSSKVGIGYIGPKVRQIVQNASFPVLVPTPVFKQWNRIVVFFGGSQNAVEAVRAALEIKRATGLPLHLFTKATRKPKAHYEELLEKEGLHATLKTESAKWLFFSKGSFNKVLYEVPSDALIVVGAYGHGAIKEILFGSKMEEIQTTLPNNMLIIGPNCKLRGGVTGAVQKLIERAGK